MSVASLWRPTLVRRVCLSLLATFALAHLLLLGVQFAEEVHKDEDPQGLYWLGAQVASQLVDVSGAHEAAATARTVDRVLRGAGVVPSPRGPLIVQVWQRDTGLRVYSSVEGEHATLVESRGRPAEQRIDGRHFRVASLDTPRWSVRVALPPLDRGWALRQLHSDLWPYVLMALPVVLLPMWLAVSRALRPLTQLSRYIGARHPDDLSPLDLKPRHGELQPLVQALERLLSQLRHKVAGERAFVQDAAHELRTPMAVITTQAHVVRMASEADEKKDAERALESAVGRASHLIGQLLELARVDRHETAAPAEVDVAALVRTLLAQATPAAMKRGIELSLDGPDALHATLDPQALHSVLSNLLDNAIRYGHDGGRVEVTLSEQGRQLVIQVADDGPGIEPQERERVFDRFYRGARRQAASGSGLGLAIAQRAAAKLGGAVTLGDGLGGRGCCFTLTFERRVAEAPAA